VTFKEAIQRDIYEVFLNENEFAEWHTVLYDGETCEDIPLVLEGPDELERQPVSAGSGVGGGRSDSAAGLYQVSVILHCATAYLGGKQP